MTTSKTLGLWKCPYCDKEYETHRQAQDCATECAHVEYPIETSREEYSCEGCRKVFDDESDAEDCEEKHLSDEFDPFHDKVRIIVNRKRLQRAAEHPAQMKIFEQAVLA